MSVFEFSQDVPCEMVRDFTMARHRLAGARVRIAIPIVTATMPDENASAFLDLADQGDSLHAM